MPTDIIALLVIGVLFIVLFTFWQGYLERVQNNPNSPRSRWTPPPLMKLSLWGRGHGRFGAIMVIALLTWCSFLSWNFWSQVYPIQPMWVAHSLIFFLALLSRLRTLDPNFDNGSILAHVRHWCIVQRTCSSCCSPRPPGVHSW